jgi:hypothetical protein
MKNTKLLKLLCVACSLIFPLVANADLTLDNNFAWKGKVQRGLEDGPITDAINRDQVADGLEKKMFYESINFLHMTWNGKNYYVAGVQYLSKEELATTHRDVAAKRASRPVPGGGVCALFLYDDQLKQLAKFPVELNEADGKTWCNGANALARVKGEDALLFSVSYYLTEKPLANKAADIGNDWRYMTTLLRLREQDGKVVVEQDDSCLGNPNTYKDVAAARKALAACAAGVPK